MNRKRWWGQFFGSDGIVLYIEYGGGHRNLYMR